MQFLHYQPSVSALSFQLAQRPVALPSSRWSIVLCIAGDVNGGCIKFLQMYKWSVRFLSQYPQVESAPGRHHDYACCIPWGVGILGESLLDLNGQRICLYVFISSETLDLAAAAVWWHQWNGDE
jgi:hypothetical protein